MLELKQTPKYHKNSIPINRVSVAVPLLDRWTVYLGGTPGSGVTKSYDSREQTAPDLCSSGGVECTPGCQDVATAEQVKSTRGAVRQGTGSTPTTSPLPHRGPVQLAQRGSARESC